MPVDIKKLVEERKKHLADAKAVVEKAETENRNLSADEDKRYADLMAKAKDLEGRVLRAQEVERAETAVPDPPQPRFSAPNAQTGGANDPPRYSLLRALRCAAAGRLDGFEAEVSQELSKRFGRAPQGFWMPYDFTDPIGQRNLVLPVERRELNLTTGTGAKPTITDTTFIELLRNRMLVRALGARVLTGLSGDLSIPRITASSTAYWFNSESGTVTVSNETIGSVPLAPNTIGAQTIISRKFLLQSSIDAESFVRDDLAQVLALELDRAVINGSGTGAEPQGILQNGTIPTVALGTNGGPPTWAAVVGLEQEVAQDNADVGSLAYLTNAKANGKMKTTPKVTGYPVFLTDVDGTVNGYRCGISNQVPSNLTKGTSGAVCSAMIFGDWSSVVMGFWSGLDVVIDPYSGAASGSLKLTMLQDADIAFRHEESFAKIVDMTTT